MSQTRHNSPSPLLGAIRELSERGENPSRIHRLLSLDESFAGDLPHVRTVQRIVRGFRTNGQTGVSLLDRTGDELLQILSVLRVCAPYLSDLTVPVAEIADFLLKINASPDSPGDQRFTLVLADAYAVRLRQGEPLDQLDTLLILAPWQSQEHLSEYQGYLERVSSDPASWPSDVVRLLDILAGSSAALGRRLRAALLASNDRWPTRVPGGEKRRWTTALCIAA